MWKRLAVVWAALKSDLRLVWFALQHPKSPGWLKLGAAAGVLYLFMPIDLIPDVIPVLGAVDDLVVLTLLLRWMLSSLPAEVRADVQHRAAGTQKDAVDVRH